jgi:hypothetical protein
MSIDRARLAELADALIPAESGMPSAGQAGAAGEWLDAVLAARPDFETPLAGLAASTAGLSADEAIAVLPERDPAGWTALTAAVVAAYYMNPDVCERIGYAGQRAIPLDPDAPPDYLEDGLLDSVRSRPPVYRPTP